MSEVKRARNPAGSGSMRKRVQRKNGKDYIYWEGRFTVGYDPGTGKQIQKTITAKTQRELAQKLREKTSEVDKGIYQPPSKMTVGEWLEIWYREYMKGIKLSTKYLYETQIRLYLKPYLSAIKLEQLTTPTIQRLYNSLEEKGLSPKSIKNVHGVLHKILQQAVAIGYLRFNPAEACTLPRIERKATQIMERDVVAEFLKAIQGHKHQVLYTVALFTGLRESEILGLMWECVDFEKNLILVDKQLQRSLAKGGDYYFSSPKSNKSRVVTVAPSVMKLLRLHRSEQLRRRLAAGSEWVDERLVFTNEIGDKLSYRTVYDCFKRIVAKMGKPDLRFHDLRHTYAVMSLENGDDIKTVQENLGHHDAAFTLNAYGHVTENMRRQSANRMELFIQEVTEA